jgi:hypothetical protein
MLIDRLGLPYDSVSTALGSLPAYPAPLWSMAKIFVYAIQSGPFLHLDGDIFLWQPLPDRMFSAGIIAQNPEKDLAFYREALDTINNTFSYIPWPFARGDYEGRPLMSANAGFFGGHDLAFIREYCRRATDFIDNNIGQAMHTPNLNFIYEQYLLYRHAEAMGKKITWFQETVVDEPLYKDYVRFQDLPYATMIHPVGGFKRMQFVCHHIAKYLREYYPDWYYRVIGVMRDAGISMTSKIYHSLPGPEYHEEMLAYRATRAFLSMDESQRLHARLQAAPGIQIRESVVSIPDPILESAVEYDMDTLDMLVLECCTDGISVEALLKELREYFDEEELAADPAGYLRLVGDTVKRLLFANILRVSAAGVAVERSVNSK